MDVETKTCWDWAKDVDTETPSRLSLISDADPHKIRKGWGLPPQINSMNEKLTMAHTTEINEYGPYPFPWKVKLLWRYGCKYTDYEALFISSENLALLMFSFSPSPVFHIKMR